MPLAPIPLLTELDCRKPFAGPVFVSPACASAVFTNSDQQIRTPAKIADLLRAIHAGDWENFRADPIVFLDDGELADGRHRMLAISKSSRTLGVNVICGMPAVIWIYLAKFWA